MEAYRRLADKHRLWIIEDACHAPGGYFVDSSSTKQGCGNGKYADLAIFSFHPVKHIASGEGGMITTNDFELYTQLLVLRTHGITRAADKFINSPEIAAGTASSEYPGWYMEMQELGFNYRLTDFQAALGLSQLKRADPGLERRRQIARRYAEAFASCSFILGQSGVVDGHAYHLYIIQVSDRLGLYNYLRKANVFAQIHYIPVHLMPYYQGLGWRLGDFPEAEHYYTNCISLPMFPTLTDEEQGLVIEKVIAFYNE